ncbi:MAG TPA: MEKHLA domain-containing protein [Nitrospira sp.]|nr:MEKHLA domain-containing protein [Nitrospira sp.]
MMSVEPWKDPAVIEWTQHLLESYRHWLGKDLIERRGEPEYEARALFESPLVVVSHGTETDPVLNYGNQTALQLWQMSWQQLVTTPSRLTAEPIDRAERERMLEEARVRGFIDTYRGIRISGAGRRFLVENAFVWNVLNTDHERIGQAATFSRWTWLP